MSEKPDLATIMRAMMQGTPHAAALGATLVDCAPGRIRGALPYRADLIGDPETGVISGGVITTLLDQLMGAAVLSALEEPVTIATLDLRIDYMRPAAPNQAIQAEAHCYKVGRSVAFVRGAAFETSSEDPVAHAVATFALGTPSRRRRG